MGGRRQDRTILRPDFWNAGTRTGTCIPAAESLSAQNLSTRQTAEYQDFELSGSTSSGLLFAIYVVAEHPCYHTIAAQKVNLKAMCLLLCARFRVDTADVFFRLRIGTFSSWHND